MDVNVAQQHVAKYDCTTSWKGTSLYPGKGACLVYIASHRCFIESHIFRTTCQDEHRLAQELSCNRFCKVVHALEHVRAPKLHCRTHVLGVHRHTNQICCVPKRKASTQLPCSERCICTTCMRTAHHGPSRPHSPLTTVHAQCTRAASLHFCRCTALQGKAGTARAIKPSNPTQVTPQPQREP